MAATDKPDITRVWAELAAAPDVVDPGDTKWQNGWGVEIPPHETFNFLQQTFSQALKHLSEFGISKWDIDTNYQTGGITLGSDLVLYRSKTSDNSGNDPISSPANWEPALSTDYIVNNTSLPGSTLGDVLDSLSTDEIANNSLVGASGLTLTEALDEIEGPTVAGFEHSISNYNFNGISQTPLNLANALTTNTWYSVGRSADSPDVTFGAMSSLGVPDEAKSLEVMVLVDINTTANSTGALDFSLHNRRNADSSAKGDNNLVFAFYEPVTSGQPVRVKRTETFSVGLQAASKLFDILLDYDFSNIPFSSSYVKLFIRGFGYRST